jgi:tetratricopeptide (TPR) repeat protein
MAGILTNDLKLVRSCMVPDLEKEGDAPDLGMSAHAMLDASGLRPVVVLDLFAAAVELQQDGNDEIGYRLRVRAPAGVDAAKNLTFYMQRRNGQYLIAAANSAPESIGHTALQLANDGKTDAARTWLNWARESIAAGGGDDPLSGPPFARLWQKEKQAASLDEIRLAAAALMAEKYPKASAPLLVSLRDTAPSDDAKTAADIALVSAYTKLHDWEKALPIAERLSKAHPDSGSAFSSSIVALTQTGNSAEAETIAKERLARLPKDADAMRAMILIYAKKGDYDTAVAWSRRTVDEVTPVTKDYNMAAWLALFAGKSLDRAIDDARHGSADDADATYGALHTLAALYAESGKSVEARQALLKGMDKRGTDDPGSDDWFVLGRIAENYGVRDVAMADYKRVEKSDLNGTSTWELTQRRIAAMPK